jgi:hypothetical protein
MAGARDATRKNGTLTLTAKLVELCFGGGVAWSEQGDASVVDEDVDVTVACRSGPLAFDLGNHVFGLVVHRVRLLVRERHGRPVLWP